MLVEGEFCSLEMPEVICCVLLGTLDVLDALDVTRCYSVCLRPAEGDHCLLEVLGRGGGDVF